jgi:hypothetical protein
MLASPPPPPAAIPASEDDGDDGGLDGTTVRVGGGGGRQVGLAGGRTGSPDPPAAPPLLLARSVPLLLLAPAAAPPLAIANGMPYEVGGSDSPIGALYDGPLGAGKPPAPPPALAPPLRLLLFARLPPPGAPAARSQGLRGAGRRASESGRVGSGGASLMSVCVARPRGGRVEGRRQPRCIFEGRHGRLSGERPRVIQESTIIKMVALWTGFARSAYKLPKP